MKQTLKPHLTKSLKQLHLPAFAEHHAAQAAIAANESWTYDQFLLQLCEFELQQREARKIERLLHVSKLPREKTLDSFERARLKRPVERQFAALLDGSFLERRENVLVFGNPGSGKTRPNNYPAPPRR